MKAEREKTQALYGGGKSSKWKFSEAEELGAIYTKFERPQLPK